MISSCVVVADLKQLKSELEQLEFCEYEASVDGKHIVLIEAPCEDEMIGAFKRLSALGCVQTCELIFSECEAPKLAKSALESAEAINELAALEHVSYYPSEILKSSSR